MKTVIMNIENIKKLGKIIGLFSLSLIFSGVLSAKTIDYSDGSIALTIQQVEEEMVQSSRYESAAIEFINGALREIHQRQSDYDYSGHQQKTSYSQSTINLEINSVEVSMVKNERVEHAKTELLATALQNVEPVVQTFDPLWSSTEIEMYLNVVDEQMANRSWNESVENSVLHGAIREVSNDLQDQYRYDSASVQLNTISDSEITLMVNAVDYNLDWNDWLSYSTNQILSNALITLHAINSINATLTKF